MDPAQLNQSSLLLSLLAVLSASLAGSFHCVTMCGGLAAATTARSTQSVFLYHLFRLIGYITIGAFAGMFGGALISQDFSQTLSWFSAALIGATLVYSGWSLLTQKPMHFGKWFSKLSKYFMPFAFRLRGSTRSAVVGLFSVFLPCGWLYTFVVSAMATQNLWVGSSVLFAFWLGTLPGLVFGGLSVNWLLSRLQGASRIVVAVLLVTLGVVTLSKKVNLIHTTSVETQTSCHE